MKKYKVSLIICMLVIFVSIPIFAIYMSFSIGEKAIKYGLNIKGSIEIKNANSPKLSNGMIPITYDEEKSCWKVADLQNENSSWYDYFNKKWANIMMSDGNTYISEDISTDANLDGKDDTTGKTIAKTGDLILEENLGSMFVWIPRFQYQIDSTNKIIKVKYNSIGESITDGYTLHPAFENGSATGKNNNFENGEWDKDIDGFWFAKFESTQDTTLGIKVLPNQKSYNQISIQNSYSISRAATYSLVNQEDINKLNSHLIKNSEWGAVAYLSWSNYGTDGVDIFKNNFFNRDSIPNVITGLSGITADDSETIKLERVYKYDTIEGQKASTTGNIYGIYDMKGGTTEYTATVLSGKSLNSADDGSKYITKYFTNSQKIGDAILETKGWNKDNSITITSSLPYFMRGEPGTSVNELAGYFAYNAGNGTASNFRGFRVGLIVENLEAVQNNIVEENISTNVAENTNNTSSNTIEESTNSTENEIINEVVENTVTENTITSNTLLEQ